MPTALHLTRDGNYLISFYNNGQIWKVNATTGNVIWKFGRMAILKYRLRRI